MSLTPEERAAKAIYEAARRRENRERRQTIKAARKPGGKASRGRERDPGFLAYLRRQPCEARHMGGCSGPVQAAHIRFRDARYPNSAGAQVKNHDRHANPLCDWHHNHDQHTRSERAFWAAIGKDAYETAAGHYARYMGANDDAPEGEGRAAS